MTYPSQYTFLSLLSVRGRSRMGGIWGQASIGWAGTDLGRFSGSVVRMCLAHFVCARSKFLPLQSKDLPPFLTLLHSLLKPSQCLKSCDNFNKVNCLCMLNLPLILSEFFRPPSNTPETFGPWSTQSLTTLTLLHTSSSLTATLCQEPMMLPIANAPTLNNMNDFPNYPFFLYIFLFVNDSFPFIHIQAPPSFPIQLRFPAHHGPPFIQVYTTLSFDRHFNIQSHICKLAWSSTLSTPFTSDKTSPSYLFYIFSICISPCNTTDHLFHDNLEAANTLNQPRPSQPLSYQPPSTTTSIPWPNLVPLLTTSPPHTLRRINNHLPPSASAPLRLHQLTMKPLPLPPYHLQPPMYYSRLIITPALSHPPSINNNATLSAAMAPISTSILISYLRHIFQWVRSTLCNSLRHPGRQRHDLFVLISSFSLTNPLFPATCIQSFVYCFAQ